MKNLALQKIIFSFFITLFFPSSCMMNTLKKISYKCIENRIVYRIGVKIIDNASMALSHFAIWFIHFMHNRRHRPIAYALFEHRAQNRLNQINDELLKREAQLVNAIYDDYDISTEYREIINSLTDQSKKHEKKYMSEPHQEATHGVEFPPHIIALCTANNIHPNSIKTIINSAKQGHDATAYGFNTEVSIISNILHVKRIIAPPTIEFYSSFFRLLKDSYNSSWAHELRHLVCQHSTMKGSLISLITHITATSYEKMVSNQNYLLLKVEHERQAEILHNNAQLASITRNARRNGYYAGTLFLSHYAQLAEIDELYRFPDRLRAYKPIPLQKINSLTYYKSSFISS